jgi:putative transposase
LRWRCHSPWKGLDDVELARLEYVDWFDHSRLHSACGDFPPVEFEQAHFRSMAALSPEVPAQASLH